jgi:hypothetical protein
MIYTVLACEPECGCCTCSTKQFLSSIDSNLLYNIYDFATTIISLPGYPSAYLLVKTELLPNFVTDKVLRGDKF